MNKKSTFEGLWIPAAVLARKEFSKADNDILADLAYFDGNGSDYNFTYPGLAQKFGVTRSTIIRSIERLSGDLGYVVDTGGKYYHKLKLTDKGRELFSDAKPPKRQRRKPEVKPRTAAEVDEYAASIGRKDISGAVFLDYYTKRNWIKKNGKPVLDWRGTLRNWKRNNNDGTKNRETRKDIDKEYIR